MADAPPSFLPTGRELSSAWEEIDFSLSVKSGMQFSGGAGLVMFGYSIANICTSDTLLTPYPFLLWGAVLFGAPALVFKGLYKQNIQQRVEAIIPAEFYQEAAPVIRAHSRTIDRISLAAGLFMGLAAMGTALPISAHKKEAMAAAATCVCLWGVRRSQSAAFKIRGKLYQYQAPGPRVTSQI